MSKKIKWIGMALALCLIAVGAFWQINRQQEPSLEIISRKDALEDYDYLWQTLEGNYPFLGVAERKYGLDIQQLKQEYRGKLEDMDREIDFLEFYQLMGDCVGQLNGLGHLVFYSPYLYQEHTAAREYAYSHPLSKRQFEKYLDDPEVQQRYEFLQSKEPPDSGWSAQPQSERITTQLLGDDIAYLAVNNFWGQYIQQDREELLNFFRENADIPYLIIDIRNNGGGSSEYWSENIVAPNIAERKTSPHLDITPYGEESQDQLKMDGVSEENLISQPEALKKYPQINGEDFLANWYLLEEEGYVVSPQAEEAIYHGKIFLLVNGETGSAADGFAYFCKQSGFATVLGQENTRGDGPGGNFMLDRLPHSNLLFRYRPVQALDMDGAGLEEFGVVPDALLSSRAKNSHDKIPPLAACRDYIENLE